MFYKYFYAFFPFSWRKNILGNRFLQVKTAWAYSIIISVITLYLFQLWICFYLLNNSSYLVYVKCPRPSSTLPAFKLTWSPQFPFKAIPFVSALSHCVPLSVLLPPSTPSKNRQFYIPLDTIIYVCAHVHSSKRTHTKPNL